MELQKLDKLFLYAQMKRDEDNGNHVYQGWLQANLGTILYEKGSGKFAIQEIASMLENEHPCELVRLILYSLLITLYARQKHSPEVIQYGLQF